MFRLADGSELVIAHVAAELFVLTRGDQQLGHVGPFPGFYLVDDSEYVAAAITLDPNNPARMAEVDGEPVPATADGIWLTFPRPFTRGMQVHVVLIDRQGQRYGECVSDPLTPELMGPTTDPAQPGTWGRVGAQEPRS